LTPQRGYPAKLARTSGRGLKVAAVVSNDDDMPGFRLATLVAVAVLIAVPAARATEGPAPVLVVGDSLAVGMEPYLGAMLAPRTVVWDAHAGRTTPWGLMRLRSRLGEAAFGTVVISLGTNDGPDPRRFASRIRRALRAIPASACVVWPDINRPPRKGRYHALNRVLDEAAAHDRRLVLVHWDRAVLKGRVALPDGLHPDAAGFEYRSQMIAGAVARGC
jgi:lysophospholipase L1-like esterase